MKIRKVKHTIAAVTLGALAAYQPLAAKADDTAEEIRLLKTRLKQLEEKVAKQDHKQKEMEARARHAAARQPGAPVNAPPIMAQVPVYSLPKIPGSSAQRPSAPPPYGIGLPGEPPSYQTGGLAGLEAELKGNPYIGPSSLYVNGVSITPGGFFELASVTRNHFVGADVATPWQNIPFANVPSTHTGEFRLSARRSRASLLVRGDVTPTTHLAGYGEFDWLSAAQTANSNQSDSYNLRIRHLYLTVDNDDFGAHFLAGHTFTLATTNLVGILPRTEDTPLVIEDQYVPGFVWDRQDQIRVVKDFDQKLWFALSAENPATTFGGVAPTDPTVINVLPGVISPPSGQGTIVGGSLFNSINPLSLNQMPDLIGKVAWDPTIGDRTIHMEAFGIFRSFVDRVVLPASSIATTGFINHNNNSTGGGVGGAIIVPIIPKVLEAQFSGLTGRGIGRYGAAQLPDVTFNADGSLAPIPETMLLAGLVWHAMPGLDFYSYAGEEYESPKFGFTPLGTANFVGWGNPFFNNSGCEIELSTVCSGNVKLVRQITGGFWDDIYKGPWGRLAGGLQYSFTEKYGFAGDGYSPKQYEHMFFTSLRYYPF
ncbi:MAG: hypothetical protein WBE80_07445 [Methylocella sp.]